MKALLISIKPKYVVKILNGKKTIEVRKRFPKDYKGWVYIYCTKDSKMNFVKECWTNSYTNFAKEVEIGNSTLLNGKVIARFYCDKVEEIRFDLLEKEWFTDDCETEKELLQKSQLTQDELDDYLGVNRGYAIHISNLEIFDKPKELGEFRVSKKVHKCDICIFNPLCAGICVKETYSTIKTSLTKAPQSWCYVEVEE